MAIVIRVAYNNKDWKGPCDTPWKDNLCWYCFEGQLQIKAPQVNDVVCSGDCWEKRLCTEYRWGCTPKGRVYGSDAYKGAKVFFVYKQRNGNYTIWGRAQVSSVDDKLMQSSNEFENGYSYIHFEQFEPLSQNKWVKDIPDTKLVGARWLQGRHRYINIEREQFLDGLIDGLPIEKIANVVEPKGNEDGSIDVTVKLMLRIYRKIEKIALEEGRSKDEVFREAIAEWVKNR